MNENKLTEINEDLLFLNEEEKVVIQDEELAKVSEELTLEELEQVVGSRMAMYGPPPPPL